jgi:hypothetical protein
MNDPLLVEVIAYAPTAYYHCMHCEIAFREMKGRSDEREGQISSSLPEELRKEYEQLSDWVREIFNQHGNRIVVRVIDVASIEGFIKSVRYGVRRYPALIVDRKEKFQAGAYESANQEIERILNSKVLVPE